MGFRYVKSQMSSCEGNYSLYDAVLNNFNSSSQFVNHDN